MDAAFRREIAERVLACDPHRRGLDAGFVAQLDIDDRSAEAVPLRPALIHPQQHIRPITRLGSARAGLNAEKGVIAIVWTGKQHPQLQLLELAEKGRLFRLHLGQRLG